MTGRAGLEEDQVIHSESESEEEDEADQDSNGSSPPPILYVPLLTH